ncbi:MAG TPA: right-handed parallel beta-helix repeat-containing protein [Gemmataceae bacterium]|nr:right-handed parallel beta-helix repeat-containing protein [Gemmataceae bacterium]
MRRCLPFLLGCSILAVGLGLVLRPTADAGNDPPAPTLIGDGRADNTESLRQLLRKEGTVVFPRGTFRITEPIVIDLDKIGPAAVVAHGNATLVMDGPGPAFQFVGTHAGTAAPKSIQPAVWERQRTPTVTGLEIVGKHPEADGIEAEGTMQLTLDRVVIRECRHGVRLVKRNRNVLISACHVYNNRGIGVFLDHVNLHQTIVVGSHISYCKGGGIVSRGGEVRNLQVTGCDIEGNMAPNATPTANVLLDSTGGSIAEVAIIGCTIQHESPSPESSNVRILGEGVGGLKNVPGKTKEGHVVITGNVFSDVKVNVDVQHARGVTITGNTFWMGYEYNLRVEHSEHVVIGPNDFQRNPRYDYGDATTTKNAILFRDCADCTLTGLHVHNVRGVPAGVTLERCNRFNVTGCTILDCEGVGLRLKDVTNSRVSDCLVRNDPVGAKRGKAIVVEGGSGNLFADNVFAGGAEVSAGAGKAQGNWDGTER